MLRFIFPTAVIVGNIVRTQKSYCYYKITKFQRNVVVFGYPESGKTTICSGRLMEDHERTVKITPYLIYHKGVSLNLIDTAGYLKELMYLISCIFFT
jgi:hypothetical protein